MKNIINKIVYFNEFEKAYDRFVGKVLRRGEQELIGNYVLFLL